MKEKRYQNGGVKITVKSPLTPSKDRKDEEIFYQLGECKRRNMKAV